nr:2370_t:CDS:2 [Entrophospora candida]
MGDDNNNISFSPQLPLDILFEILSYVKDSSKDLLTCSRINHAWHRLVTRFYIWKEVKVNSFHMYTRFYNTLLRISWTKKQHAIDNWIKLVKNMIRNKNINIDENKNVKLQRPLYFHSTNPYGSYIQVLDLSGIDLKEYITSKLLCSLFPNTPNLIKIDLYNCFNVNDKVVEVISESCRGLIELRIFGCTKVSDKSMAFLKRCRQLRELDIGYCIKVTSKGLKILIDNCPNLISLSFINSIRFEVDSLIPLGPDFKNFEKLFLSYCNISDGFIVSIVPFLTKLRVLDLGHCLLKLTSDTVEMIVTSCPNIEELHISCSGIDEKGIKLIRKNLENLKCIDLSRCRMITDELVEDLVKHCRRLKQIDISNNIGVTGKSFLIVAENENIEYASFDGCSMVNGILPKHPPPPGNSKMKKLSFSFCVDLSEITLQHIPNWFKGLEYLAINNVLITSCDSFYNLCNQLKHLKYIDVRNTVFMHNDICLEDYPSIKIEI